MKRIIFVIGLLPGLMYGSAYGHGVSAHVLVTDTSINYMKDCSLKELLSDPEVRSAFALGGLFPDTGYSPTSDYRYGEAPHWEPFVEAQFKYLQERYPPPYDTLEKKKVVAFNLGSMCHGMEDEIFDTLFLYKSVEEDGADQDILDMALDVFLVTDGVERIIPPKYFPIEDMFTIYTEYYKTNTSLTIEDMSKGTNAVYGFALENFHYLAPGIEEAEGYREKAPWSAANYMDIDVPGSFAYEWTIIGPFMDAAWKRLNNEFTEDDLIIGAVPRQGARLLSIDSTSVDSWITLYFGKGVLNRTLNDQTISLLDPDGQPVPAVIKRTRWGSADDESRLVRIMPTVDLEYDSEYTVVIEPGLKMIGGEETTKQFTYKFFTGCADSSAELCPSASTSPIDNCTEPPVIDEPPPKKKKSENDDNNFGCSAAGGGSLFMIGALAPAALAFWRKRRLKRK